MRVGDVFAVPLRVGGVGVAIVIDAQGGIAFLVLDRFWNERPTAEELGELREMPMSFGQKPLPGQKDVFKGWFQGDVPADFKVISNRPLTKAQNEMRGAEGTMVFQNARDFARTLSDQWRWLHDRDAYLRELGQASDRFEKARAKRAANLSFESMLGETFFKGWEGRWPDDRLAEARRILGEATTKLAALKASGTPRKRTNVFRKLVKAFNEIDNETGLIESVERDEIAERVDELAGLAGLDNAREKLLRGRTW